MVLCAYSEHTGALTLKNDDGTALRTGQILDWLLDLNARLKAEEMPHVIVGFGLGYDIAEWLYDFPERAARRLYAPARAGWMTEKGIPRWAGAGPYLCRFMGSEFAVTEAAQGIGARATKETRKSVTVWDVWKFFQGSFVNALTKWQILDPESLRQMEAMKRRRSTFTADEIDQEIIDYCISECKAGVALMTKLAETCRELGYPLRRYDGAGSLAAAMLKAWGIDQYMADVPEKMHHAVACAYVGGWFENESLGLITEPVIQWDINSAYPFVIQHLPCLAHAEWKASTDVEPWGLYNVEFKYPSPCKWGALPYRNRKGEITHPAWGSGWYWGIEVIAAERLYPGSHVIKRGWKLVRKCNHIPFEKVPEVYAERQRLGKGTKGEVLKLGLNSLYGKTAQSIGQPKYANYIWAGMITAGCRAKILEAMRIAGPENVTGVATDAIYTTADIVLPSSPDKPLGLWDKSIAPKGALIIQPGISISYDSNGVGLYKSRGLGKYEFAHHAKAAENAWATLGIMGNFRAESHRFVGIKAAIARGKYADRCRWVNVSTSLKFHPGTKRKVTKEEHVRQAVNRVRYGAFTEPIRTLAPDGEDEESYPYKRIHDRLTNGGYGDNVYDTPAPECEYLELTTKYA